MKYAFFDREGKLLGRSEDPEGAPIKRNDEITVQLKGQMPTRWRAIGVSAPVQGVQMVAVRPV